MTQLPEASRPDRTPTDPATLGFVLAAGTYLLWGFLPFYMKAVAHVSVFEVVAYRILWSLPIAALVLWLTGRTADVRAAFRSPKMLMMAALTATTIAFNWGIYVWAIGADRALETALGYYINPLVTVTIGALLLGEKLDKFQIFAVLLAALAVLILSIESGGLPWVSLALAFSFATYGYLRKTLPIGPSQGFFLEVAILTPIGLAIATYFAMSGTGHFMAGNMTDNWLLLAAGPVTAVPLILFAFGSKMLKISTIGMMQYITPTMVAIIAVLVFNEPFGTDRAIAFGLIWIALALYTYSMLRNHRRNQSRAAVQEAS